MSAVLPGSSHLEREGGLCRFDHPLDGVVSLEQLILRPAGRTGHTLVMLLEQRDLDLGSATTGCRPA